MLDLFRPSMHHWPVFLRLFLRIIFLTFAYIVALHDVNVGGIIMLTVLRQMRGFGSGSLKYQLSLGSLLLVMCMYL